MSTALFVSSDNPDLGELNSSLFRVLIPADHLRAAGHTIHHQNVPLINHADYGDVDQIDWSDIPEVVMIERTLTVERVNMLRECGARRIILTFDDNYALIPDGAPSRNYWRRNLPNWLEALGLVDLVIVPSAQLARDFGHRCREIQVVPNYHDGRLWTGERPQRDYLVLGWGGSQQHVQSWMRSGIIPGLRTALEKHPNWRLHLHGYTAVPELSQAGLAPEIFPWTSLEQWTQHVIGFDLGLAPLHGDYDARRSNLKVLEYGLAGVPYLATRLTPYTEAMNPGGLLVDHPSLWGDCLDKLMRDEEKRMQLGQCGREWAQARTMEKNVGIYEKLLWG